MASTTDATATDAKRTRRNLRASLITLGLAAVTGIGLLTAALFTSTATVGGNTFSTGKVDLTASPATAAVTLANMAPGDVVTAPITVANSGTLALRYAVKSTTTENTLAGQLQMSIKTGVTTCTTAGFGATGTALYNPGCSAPPRAPTW